MEAMICLVLGTIPAVLAGMCSKGWETAKGPLCTGGGYEECAAHWTAHCWTECYGHAIDLYTMGCHAHCIQRSHQRCSGWCASVGNCADCMKAFQLAAASGNPEAGREQCSKEGCKFSLDFVYASVQPLTTHFSGPLLLWL